MANIDSLKPFQNGYDPRRNLSGRPRGSGNVRTSLMKLLEKEVGEGANKTTVQQLLIHKIIDKAVKGDRAMIKLIWEYMDGKPPTQKRRPYGRYE